MFNAMLPQDSSTSAKRHRPQDAATGRPAQRTMDVGTQKAIVTASLANFQQVLSLRSAVLDIAIVQKEHRLVTVSTTAANKFVAQATSGADRALLDSIHVMVWAAWCDASPAILEDITPSSNRKVVVEAAKKAVEEYTDAMIAKNATDRREHLEYHVRVCRTAGIHASATRRIEFMARVGSDEDQLWA